MTMGSKKRKVRSLSVIRLANQKKEAKLLYEEANVYMKCGNLMKALLSFKKFHQTAYEFIVDRAEVSSINKNFVSHAHIEAFHDRKLGILLNASITTVQDIKNFHQTAYEFIVDRGEILRINTNFISDASITPFRNRKLGILLNASVTTVQDIEDVKVNIEAFQLFSNQYRSTNLKVGNVPGCMLAKKLDMAQVLKTTNGNFTDCPLIKGTYLAYNIHFDSSKLPPLIPEGSYKVVLQLVTDNSVEITAGAVYGRIVYFLNKKKSKK